MLPGLLVFSISSSLSVIATIPFDRIWRAVTPSFRSQKMIDCVIVSHGSFVCRYAITYHQDIDPAKDEYNYTGADDDSPEGNSNGLLRGSLFVQVAENIDTKNNHSKTEEVKAMRVAQNRPVGPKPTLENSTFGNDEEHLKALV